MSIGRRLTIAFASVSLVIVCGALIARWEFLGILREANALKADDDQVVAVYRVRADLETLRRKLDAIADTRDRTAFESSDQKLEQSVFEDIARAETLFQERGAPVPGTLRALRDTLASQFDAMQRLAEAGDWGAISLRLNNQLESILDEVREMVEFVNADVNNKRNRAESEIETDQARAQIILAFTAIASLLISAGFGLYVTRTIVGPLKKLETAAHRLAAGDFDVDVDVHSNDELGEVSHAFTVAAEKLNTSYAALKFSNESLEQFAYAASHDLQEPIRTISLLSDLIRLRHAESLDPKAKEHFKHLAGAATRMRELVSGILEYSRLTEADAQHEDRIEMNQVAATVIENIRGIVSETGAIVTFDKLPEVCGNRLQLMQLCQNLISNAIKYRRELPPKVHVSAKPDGRLVEFCVQDNGLGIPAEYHDQIFGVFKQLDRGSHEGVGIGLAITKRIVERHGGSIWLESTPGVGSRFYFTLKRPDEAQPTAESEVTAGNQME